MALEFNGTTDIVSLPIGSIPDVTEHTITCWCNLNDISLAGGNRSLVNMNDILTPFSGISLFIKGEDDGTAGRIGGVIAGFQFTATPAVTINNWHLAAIRGEQSVSSTVDVSVDGGLWTNLVTGDTSNLQINATDLQALGASQELLYFTDGSLADARVYNRQLSQNEIITIYTAKGQDAIVNGLLGRWTMLDAPVGIAPGSLATSFVDSTEASVTLTTSITVTVPTVNDGDLLLACICPGGDNTGVPAVVTTPSGWTLINTGDTDLPSTGSTPSLWTYNRTASSEPLNYTFNINQTANIAGHMLSYRNLASNTPETTSSLNTGTSITPVSPLIAGAGIWLAIRVCATDDDEIPATETDFYPTGTNGREATGVTASGRGCSLGTADDSDPSISRTWNPDAAEQWGCLTIRFSANEAILGVKDISANKNDGDTSSISANSELRF